MKLGDNLLSAKQLAAMLKIKRRALYYQLKNGPSKGSDIDPRQIPYKRLGGRRFWDREAVYELLGEEAP